MHNTNTVIDNREKWVSHLNRMNNKESQRKFIIMKQTRKEIYNVFTRNETIRFYRHHYLIQKGRRRRKRKEKGKKRKSS